MDSFLIIASTWLLPDHEFFIKYAISFLFSKKGRKKSNSTFSLYKHLLSIYCIPGLHWMLGRKEGKMERWHKGRKKGKRGASTVFKEATVAKQEK